MRPWVRYRGGRARYSGWISRWPFKEWTETPEAKAAIATVAGRFRVQWLARVRAERKLWKQLAAMARQRAVVVSIQSEADAYPARLQEFAYADGLPRVGVELHRLVVVPRVLVNGATYGAIARRLHGVPAFASLAGGDALREFFVLTVVQHLDAAVSSARPSPKRPVAAGKDWVSVGLNAQFVWRVPLLKDPPWNGHHYVLELTRDPVTRALRKAVAAAIAQIESALPGLSKSERNEILRRAVGK
jgi:hypothetical protein